jgi:threonine aldolase
MIPSTSFKANTAMKLAARFNSARNLYKSSSKAAKNSSKRIADFRSDTVTTPTPAMLQYMMQNIAFGDDVFKECSVTNAFERRVADLCGKQDALFCSSGTLANQLA